MSRRGKFRPQAIKKPAPPFIGTGVRPPPPVEGHASVPEAEVLPLAPSGGNPFESQPAPKEPEQAIEPSYVPFLYVTFQYTTSDGRTGIDTVPLNGVHDIASMEELFAYQNLVAKERPQYSKVQFVWWKSLRATRR